MQVWRFDEQKPPAVPEVIAVDAEAEPAAAAFVVVPCVELAACRDGGALYSAHSKAPEKATAAANNSLGLVRIIMGKTLSRLPSITIPAIPAVVLKKSATPQEKQKAAVLTPK